MNYTTSMGVQPYFKPLSINCTFRITAVPLHLLVSSLKYSLWLLGLLTESLDYTRLMDAPPKVLPMFVGSTYRITALHFTYGYATLSAAYVGYL